MFLDYEDFLLESIDDNLFHATKIATHHIIKKALADCLIGKYPHIQVHSTTGATSYIGVAFHDGSSISDVYKTEDPGIALVAIIMKGSELDNPHKIAKELTMGDGFVNYEVYPGNKAPTQMEVANRFNAAYKNSPGDNISMVTSTPIQRIF